MEAIIAHPAKGAKRSPASKKAAPAPQSSTPDKQASWKPVELKPTALHEAAAFIKQSVANCNAEVWAMADSDSGDDLEMGLANLMTWLDRKIDVEGLEFGVDPVAAFSLLQQDIRSVISVLRCALSYRQLPGLVDVVGALENSVGAAMDIELALRNGAKPFRDRPTPPIRRIQPGTGEKTPAQLMRVLQFAAEQAGNANDILMMLQAIPKLSHEVYVLVNSAQAITQYIGAATDDALGGDISGDFEHWTYGPNFADAGKGEEE
ncbi:hypothetical protein ACFIQG_20220 [Comamonas odontotermitis]|uniref:hypothetical protein n=1 Tax=Comamonas odontotermitis TaxID=379895 RepID=UPI0036735280